MKAKLKKPNKRKCHVCGDKYIPHQSFQQWCTPECGLVLARKKQEKAAERARIDASKKVRAKYREQKEGLKGKGELAKEAQSSINRYVRYRDHDKKCVSCGGEWEKRVLTGTGWDCGHYRSRGSANHLRFNLKNMAKQCVYCNRNLSGNVQGFRKGLIERIGLDEVEKLENDNSIRKFTKEYYRRIKKIFNKRANILKERYDL